MGRERELGEFAPLFETIPPVPEHCFVVYSTDNQNWDDEGYQDTGIVTYCDRRTGFLVISYSVCNVYFTMKPEYFVREIEGYTVRPVEYTHPILGTRFNNIYRIETRRWACDKLWRKIQRVGISVQYAGFSEWTKGKKEPRDINCILEERFYSQIGRSKAMKKRQACVERERHFHCGDALITYLTDEVGNLKLTRVCRDDYAPGGRLPLLPESIAIPDSLGVAEAFIF